MNRLLTEPVVHRSDLVAPSPSIPRQRQTRLNPDQVTNLLADYQAGLSVRQLADRYHVRWETAQRWLKINGIERRQNKTGIPCEQRAEAARLHEAGWTYTQIARHYGCSHTAARTTILKFIQAAAEES